MPILSATGARVPQYANPADYEGIKDGLYLGLFHGRSHPDEQMNDWGSNGPVIGPLRYVHTTYQSDIKLEFIYTADREKYFTRDVDAWISIQRDLAVYNGAYYGDWSVFNIPLPPYHEPLPSIPMADISLESWFTLEYACEHPEGETIQWCDDDSDERALSGCPSCGTLCSPHSAHKIETV